MSDTSSLLGGLLELLPTSRICPLTSLKTKNLTERKKQFLGCI
jgi:hypothetical protein